MFGITTVAYVMVSFVYGFYTGINHTFYEGGIENATESGLFINKFDEVKYYQDLAGNVLTTKESEEEDYKVNVERNEVSTKTFEGEGDENVVTDNELEPNKYEEEDDDDEYEDEQPEEEEEDDDRSGEIEVWTKSSSEQDMADFEQMERQEGLFSETDIDKMEEVVMTNKSSSEEDVRNLAEILSNERSSAEEMENVSEIALLNATYYNSEEAAYGAMKGNALTTNMTRVEFLVHGRVKGVSFKKHLKQEADRLGLRGWCMTTHGLPYAIQGVMEGPDDQITEMQNWLMNVGSPKSTIHDTDFAGYEFITDYMYQDFSIKHWLN